MSDMQQTDLFATLPRRPNSVSAAAYLQAHAAIIAGAPSASLGANHAAATSFNRSSDQGAAKPGSTSQPSAPLKSP
jgi:hypothetical protein